MLLAGRAAEETVFHEITTGAHNDLQKATDIARSMITLYGMNEDLGHVAFPRREASHLPVPGVVPPHEYSEHTARLIDDEVRRMLEQRMRVVKSEMSRRRDALHRVAERLLEVETLEVGEFLALLREAGVTPPSGDGSG